MFSKSIISVLFILIMSSVQAQDFQTVQQQIDSIYLKEKLSGGILVGILQNGKRQFYTAGYADSDQKVRFDANTIFEAGSITKTFTAYILMKVLAEKKINEKTSILKYLPDSVQANKSLEKISFLNLMNQTSGLPRLPDNLSVTGKAPYDDYKLKDLYEFLKKYNLQTTGKYEYSNLGFGLAGILAERIAGKTYEKLLQTYIYEPFGMLKNIKNSNKAKGYFEGKPTPFWQMNCLASAGSVQCSADDMLSYLENISVPNSNNKILIDTLTSETAVVNKKVSIARGWHIFKSKDYDLIWHNGGTYGFSTFTAFSKNQKNGIIVVVNEFNKNQISDVLGIKLMEKI
jgi:CubicO group peptidase (beta-lactamase class C family)